MPNSGNLITIRTKTDFDRKGLLYLAGMTIAKALIISGILLTLAALLVTGTTYKEHGTISTDIMIAAAAALIIGIGLVIAGAKKNSK